MQAEAESNNELGLAFARAAGGIHDRILKEAAELNLGKPKPPAHYLQRLEEAGVIGAEQSAQLAEMIGIVTDLGRELDQPRIDELDAEIKGANSPVAMAIAGVVAASARSASTPVLRSVAGDDAIGALIGGVSGAVAGAMVGGKVGAVFGGSFGAVLVGGLASAQAAGYL